MAAKKSPWSLAKDLLAAGAMIAITVLAGVMIYRWTTASLIPATPGAQRLIDYTNVVVILLTTVTVLFTVAALALTLLGAIGFRNMKKSAETFVQSNISTEIDRAFEQGGIAYDEIKSQFQDPGHAMHRWLRNEIERQVKEQISLYAPPGSSVNEEDPTDEGDTE